ncbi:MAG: hypothetical protein HY059_04355 [Proteobacteria bacterium]|nr:hypothetical protein [Pseudomonadota bacterium]
MSGATADPVEALVLDLIEWLAAAPRDYAQTMAAWRTSCPRLPVWEDAVDRGLVERGIDLVVPTRAGLSLLAAARAQR